MVEDGEPYDSAGVKLLDLRAIAGYFPFVQDISHDGSNLTFDMFYLNSPLSLPELEVFFYDTIFGAIYSLSADSIKYHASGIDLVKPTGWFRVSTVDSNDTPYEFMSDFQIVSLDDTVRRYQVPGPDGSCELTLDSANLAREVAVLTTIYPPVRAGVGEYRLKAGNTLSWTFMDAMPLSGSAYLKIRYDQMEIAGYGGGSDLELSLQVYKWNPSIPEWQQVGGTADTTRHQIVAQIPGPGVYAAFTEELAMTGDADGSGDIDIDDVVFEINYIFAGGPAPDPYESGDSDCSGAIDIDDVVYLISYIFSGGPPPGDPDNDGVPDC